MSAPRHRLYARVKRERLEMLKSSRCKLNIVTTSLRIPLAFKVRHPLNGKVVWGNVGFIENQYER